MLVASWRNGILEVSVAKAAPGLVVVERAEGGRDLIPSDGLGIVYAKAASKPRGVWWMNAHLMSAEVQSRITKAEAPPKGKKLPAGEHRTKPSEYKDVPDDEFAGKGYTFPVNTASRVHSALAYFSKHPWPTASQKRSAARKILAAAKKFGIKVSKDDDVYKAAH